MWNCVEVNSAFLKVYLGDPTYELGSPCRLISNDWWQGVCLARGRISTGCDGWNCWDWTKGRPKWKNKSQARTFLLYLIYCLFTKILHDERLYLHFQFVLKYSTFFIGYLIMIGCNSWNLWYICIICKENRLV